MSHKTTSSKTKSRKAVKASQIAEVATKIIEFRIKIHNEHMSQQSDKYVELRKEITFQNIIFNSTVDHSVFLNVEKYESFMYALAPKKIAVLRN